MKKELYTNQLHKLILKSMNILIDFDDKENKLKLKNINNKTNKLKYIISQEDENNYPLIEEKLKKIDIDLDNLLKSN